MVFEQSELSAPNHCTGGISDGIYYASDKDKYAGCAKSGLYPYCKGKGCAPAQSYFKHALKNALIPVVTYVGPMVAYILTGSMVVENIFTIGGLGTEFVTSIVNRDYTMIMAITIFLAVLMVVANLLTDIAYKLIDPRITFE